MAVDFTHQFPMKTKIYAYRLMQIRPAELQHITVLSKLVIFQNVHVNIQIMTGQSHHFFSIQVQTCAVQYGIKHFGNQELIVDNIQTLVYHLASESPLIYALPNEFIVVDLALKPQRCYIRKFAKKNVSSV